MAGYVLDTHTWLWLVTDDPGFDRDARTELQAAAHRNELYLAAISVWEVAMLEARRRIALARSIEDWVDRALAVRGLGLVPLSPEIVIESIHLPGTFHADLADRMIVATARSLGAAIATRDRRILDYGVRGHVRALAV